MWMIQCVGMVLMTVLTSFYLFPFEFTFFPGVNTKMAMAGFGLILLAFQLARQRDSLINRDLFQLSLWAGLVSLIGLVAVAWNDTPDYEYASYIVSMWVWLSGAYVVILSMRKIHGIVSVELICRYLIIVCVLQCLIAIAMDQYPSIRQFVDSFLGSTGFMGKMENRLYGIGASLDVAGSRFSVILVLIAYLSMKISTTSQAQYIELYLIAFLIIAVIGNMISRTTTVGVIMAICYWLYASKIYTFRFATSIKRITIGWSVILLVSIPLTIYWYQTDPSFQANFRFGFEGFFSLVEKGEWDVHSNEILRNMYVFPDNLKTWLIGDGYFNNPLDVDPFYSGIIWRGYYHNTDVGYLRFIYYFGVLGLLVFCLFMCKAGRICMNRFTSYKTLFWMILLVNFIVWLKVSTDIFLVFALFLCVNKEENEEYETKNYLTSFPTT